MEKLPRIAFGTWAWGNDGTFGPALDEEALRPVFDAAMQEGTVLWDTASMGWANQKSCWAGFCGTCRVTHT